MNWRLSFICLSICAAISVSAQARDDVEFNEQFLFNTGSKIDVSRYSRGNPVMPGEYRTAIRVNGVAKMTTAVVFNDNGTPQASPCLTLPLLKQLDLQTTQLTDDGRCVDMAKAYPGSSVAFDTATQSLDLTIAQVDLVRRPPGYVDASRWDAGIPVGLLAYDLNAWHSQNPQSTQDTAYAGLRYGFNLGAWRFRSRGNANWDRETGSRYAQQDIYLQRDIIPLKAQMLVGDSYTRGDAFDSVSLRGVRLYNDDRMLPNGLSSYAPTIRGVANSNAKVTVTQSGNTIYQTTVPPGAFEINDLNTTGYGNDLNVTITEADGSQHAFSVPYSSVAQMLRPGFARWDTGAGQLKDDTLHDKPQLAYGDIYYGLNNTFTGYTGAQYLDVGFYALLAGLAMNTRMGAYALDITRSRAQIAGLPAMEGERYRLSYNKTVSETQTSLNLSASRYASEKYLSLYDAAELHERMTYRDEREDIHALQRMKNQLQVNINQPLKTRTTVLGSLYVNGSWQSYWNASGTTSSYSMGYSNTFRYGSYTVSLQRTYDDTGRQDDSLYLSVSLPFDSLPGSHHRPEGFSSLNIGMNSDFKGSNGLNMTANGSSADNRLSYSVTTTANQSPDSNLSQISTYGSYNSAWGPLGISASTSSDRSQQYSATYSGGMLLHAGGLTLTPGSPGEADALALVKASGATGARLTNGNAEIGTSGYAVLPYLSAYKENRITLDTSTLTADVEVKNNSTVAIPRSGAVVMVDFATNQGRSAVLELQRDDQGFIPLGAEVFNQKGEEIGTVGQAGQAYVRGIEKSGTLRVVWGAGKESTCTVRYRMDSGAQKVGLTTILNNQICHL